MIETGVGDGVRGVCRNLDESDGLEMPGLGADLHTGGTTQEIERVVVRVVVQRGSAAETELGQMDTESAE